MNLSAAEQVSFNLNQFDFNSLRSENKILKSKIKQLQSDLLTEQGKTQSFFFILCIQFMFLCVNMLTWTVVKNQNIEKKVQIRYQKY